MGSLVHHTIVRARNKAQLSADLVVVRAAIHLSFLLFVDASSSVDEASQDWATQRRDLNELHAAGTLH